MAMPEASSTVHIEGARRLRFPRALRILGVAVTLCPLGILALADPDLGAVLAAYWALVLGSVLVGVARANPRPEAAPGAVSVRDGALCVGGRVLVRPGSVARVAELPRADGRRVVRVERKLFGVFRWPVDLEVLTPHDAEALLTALGHGVSQRAQEFWLPSPFRRRRPGALGALVLVGCMLLPLLLVFAGLPWGVLLAVGAGLFTALVANAVLQAPQGLRVGPDGFHLRWLWQSRYVAMADIAELRATDGEVLVLLRHGPGLRLAPRWASAVERTELRMAGRRLLAALAAWRARGVDRPLAVLRPQEPEARAWMARLQALSRDAQGHYREPCLDAGTLWGVLEDPGHDPAERAGAAVVLQGSLDAKGRERLRAVLGATAEPRVRVVLDAVAETRGEQALVSALESVARDRRG
jgi:hypothetical protein